MDLPKKDGHFAVGEAAIRYPRTDEWLYLGHDPELMQERQLGRVFCGMLGYDSGEVFTLNQEIDSMQFCTTFQGHGHAAAREVFFCRTNGKLPNAP